MSVSGCGCDGMGTVIPLSPIGIKLTQAAMQKGQLPMNPNNVPPRNAGHLGLSTQKICDVYYNKKDPDAEPAAQEVLEQIDGDYAKLAQIFGTQIPSDQNDPQIDKPYMPLVVYVTGGGSQGPYGAYHFGCDATRYVVDSLKSDGTYSAGSPNAIKASNENAFEVLKAAGSGTGTNAYLAPALTVAELVESFEAFQNKGWACGNVNGEGLSRKLAFMLHPEIALVPGFNTKVSQTWWKDGHPDWVNDNSASDQDADGNGCGVNFLNYMNDYLGYSMKEIVSTGGSNLGETYRKLTGKTGQQGFQEMVNLLSTIQKPDGTLDLPADGNPFPKMPGAKSGGLGINNGITTNKTTALAVIA